MYLLFTPKLELSRIMVRVCSSTKNTAFPSLLAKFLWSLEVLVEMILFHSKRFFFTILGCEKAF